MIGLKLDTCSFEDLSHPAVPVAFHPSFSMTYQKLRKWLDRFLLSFDDAVINDLVLFYSLAKKRYLDHRSSSHLFRLVLSVYHIQRKLLSSLTLSPQARHFVARWMPTNLLFPFSSKPVLGCLMGFNVMDRCELFDEENIAVTLQKNFPDLQLVKESYYRHTSQYENVKVFYFEVEKRSGTPFSLEERKIFEESFEDKIKNSIQKLVPSVFMKLNQEEVYKNVLILSQEIVSIQDLPQVYITLEQYTGKEIVFHVSLVQIAPFHRFSFKERIFGGSFVLERSLPVRYLDGHQIEAHLFRILLPCDSSLLRSDGSLDFYAARARVVGLLTRAIGEFRDYNGGLLIKQQELLFSFKQMLPQEIVQDAEFVETFFHALVPLDKQALLDPKVLSTLFLYFQEHRNKLCADAFSVKVYTNNLKNWEFGKEAPQNFCSERAIIAERQGASENRNFEAKPTSPKTNSSGCLCIHQDKQKTFLLVRAVDVSSLDVIAPVLRSHLLKIKDWAYNTLELNDGVFLNCVLLNAPADHVDLLAKALQGALLEWSQKRKNQQSLRIALGYSMVSLDPRVGGESISSDVLRLLFEGLTRLDAEGHVQNAVAESIEVSSDLKHYTFRLRPCFWNDGSLVSAHDFAYSWKKVLSPDFITSFATLFYPIRNAREAKEGKVSVDEIGVRVLNDRTLTIELVRPTPYFIQLLARPAFSPVHRLIDQDCPQWSYQSDKGYPCNGPFQLKVNQPNQGYQLVKNPFYWDTERNRVDQIVLTPMDPFQAMQAFAKNEIDWGGNPFGSWPSFYVPGADANVISRENSSVCWIVLNTTSSPFNHPKLRSAFALAVDRERLVQDAYLPIRPAYSILLPRHRVKQTPIFPSLQKQEALRLFNEALQECGLTREQFSLQLIFHHKSMQEWTAKALKKQLQEHLEIDCQLVGLSWNASFRRMIEGRFQIGLMHWSAFIDDPIYTFNAFKFCKEGVNFSNWEDREFQRLLDLSEVEVNPFQRSSLLYKAEEVLARGAPAIPLFYQPSQAMVRKPQVGDLVCQYF